MYVVCYSPQQAFALYRRIVSVYYHDYPKAATANIQNFRYIGINCRSESMSSGVYTEIYKIPPIIHTEKIFVDSKLIDSYIKNKIKQQLTKDSI